MCLSSEISGCRIAAGTHVCSAWWSDRVYILGGVKVNLSNPLLLTCTVDVMNGWSHRSFVILLVRVCVRPLQWLGNRVVLHGSVTLPCSIDWSPSDELYSSVNSCRNRKKNKTPQQQVKERQFMATITATNMLILSRMGQKPLTVRKCASPEGFHELIHLNKRTLEQTSTLLTYWTF